MPVPKRIEIMLIIPMAIRKRACITTTIALVVTQAGVAGLDLFLSAPRCSCFTKLVGRGPPGTLPLTGASHGEGCVLFSPSVAFESFRSFPER